MLTRLQSMIDSITHQEFYYAVSIASPKISIRTAIEEAFQMWTTASPQTRARARSKIDQAIRDRRAARYVGANRQGGESV